MDTKRRLYVHLYVIPTCNLKCIHCYYDALPLRTPIDRLLTIDELRQVVRELCDAYDAYFDIEGGEMFLRRDVAQLFDLLPPEHLGRLTLTTNGVVRVTVAPALLYSLDEFRVSVESHVDRINKEIRGVTLAPILRTCAQLMAQDVPVTLRITLHKKNYADTSEMIDYFIGQGFRRFSLYEFQTSGRGKDLADEFTLDAHDLDEVVGQLCTSSLATRTEVLKLSLNRQRTDLIQRSEEALFRGGFEVVDLSGAASLTVDYDGTLGVCPWGVVGANAGMFRSGRFLSDVTSMMDAGILDHVCDHCSTVRVRTGTLVHSVA